jgi:hypothetical protein
MMAEDGVEEDASKTGGVNVVSYRGQMNVLGQAVDKNSNSCVASLSSG